VKGIGYQCLGGREFYDQEPFESRALMASRNDSAVPLDSRGKKWAKIASGKGHVAALGDGPDAAQFVVATNLATLLAHTG